MKRLPLGLFGAVLFLFAITVVLTMYSMTAEEEEGTLMGINYGNYLLPLLVINLCICFAQFKYIDTRGFNKWIIVWIIMVSLNVLFIGTNKVVNLIRVNIWTTSYLTAYLLARSNKNTLDFLVKLFLAIFFVSFFFFWLGKVFQMDNNEFGMGGSSNAIYCLVSIVPFLMFIKNKKLCLLLLLSVFICTVFSNKRGATIIMLIILIPTVNSIFSGRNNKGRRFIMTTLIGVGLLFLMYYIGNSYLNGRLIDRFNAMEETGGAGRLNIWTYLLNSYDNSSFLEQLLGHGHRAVALTGIQTAAHNDFIEVLYDYGVIGEIIYLGIHIYLIKRIVLLKKNHNPIYLSFITMYSIFFLMSMVSILIVQQRYLIYMAVYWGCMEGNRYRLSNELA